VSVRGQLGVVGLVGLSCALGAGVAHAGAASCTASTSRLGNQTCTTSSVPANPRGRFVHVSIVGEADWEVVEVATGIVVDHGHTTPRGLDRTIVELTGRYALRLGSRAARGTITNR